jgi:hypothetical protein
MKQLLFILLLAPVQLWAQAEHTCLNLFAGTVREFLLFQGVEFRQKDGVYLIKPSEKTALNQLASAEAETFKRSLVIWEEPHSKITFLPHVLVLSWEDVASTLITLASEGLSLETHNLLREQAQLGN